MIRGWIDGARRLAAGILARTGTHHVLRWPSWWDAWARTPRWTAEFVESDILPDCIPEHRVVVAREDGELWSAGMMCPCGCGDVVELALFAEAEERWRIRVGARGRVSLAPSVWRNTGCRSHYWVREGRIHWC